MKATLSQCYTESAMPQYQFLPHTADVRMQVQARTLPELFQAALAGMNHLLKNSAPLPNTTAPLSKKISLHSPDPTTLLIDFLSEILTLSQLHNALFNQVIFARCQENALTAELTGRPVATFDKDLKAVSYQEADVKKNAQGLWETVVVFDI
jgi:SHS2 domain-containing protein